MLFLISSITICYMVIVFSFDMLIGAKICAMSVILMVDIALYILYSSHKRREEYERASMSTFLRKYEDGIF